MQTGESGRAGGCSWHDERLYLVGLGGVGGVWEKVTKRECAARGVVAGRYLEAKLEAGGS